MKMFFTNISSHTDTRKRITTFGVGTDLRLSVKTYFLFAVSILTLFGLSSMEIPVLING